MALQKFTDAAGREAWIDPASNKVYTEGGTKDTYYTLDAWNQRQAKKYNVPGYGMSASTSSGSKTSTPITGGGQDWESIMNRVSEKYAPEYQSSISNLSKTAKDVMSSAKASAESYKAQIPTVQNIYSQLAQELGKTFERERATQEQQKTEALSAQQEEAARMGFETNTGFEAAQKQVTTKKYDDLLTDVADRFRINRDKLASEETKSIQELLTEANNAMMSGNKVVADINMNLAGLRQNQQKLLTDATTSIMNANTQAEANRISEEYNKASLALKSRELDLEAAKLSQTKDPTRDELFISARGVILDKIRTGELLPEQARLNLYQDFPEYRDTIDKDFTRTNPPGWFNTQPSLAETLQRQGVRERGRDTSGLFLGVGNTQYNK